MGPRERGQERAGRARGSSWHHHDPGLPEGSRLVTLEVRDTGPGVDPGIRDQLFDPGTTTKSGGWGVGLTLSKRIMEVIHGGRIELVETGSHGTAFQLHLPARVPDAATAKPILS